MTTTPSARRTGAAAAPPASTDEWLGSRSFARDSMLLEIHNEDDQFMDAVRMDQRLYYAAAWTLAACLLLASLVPWMVPPSEWVYGDDLERQVSALASSVLLSSTVFHVFPWLVRIKQSNHNEKMSGVLVAALVVNGVALAINLHLATQKTPVVEDPVLRTRVFLVRWWVEWIPLSALMTYLSEAVDLPQPRQSPRWWWWDGALAAAVLQGSACVGGALLPFATGVKSWSGFLAGALTIQTFLFLRLRGKYQALERLTTRRSTTATRTSVASSEQQEGEVAGPAIDSTTIDLSQQEAISRRTLSYELIRACSITWFSLVLLFFGNALRVQLRIRYTNNEMGGTNAEPWWGHPAGSLWCEALFDVVAKAFYTKLVVDVHRDVFDNETRSRKQLVELRRLTAVLWTASSDVIVIGVRNARNQTTALLSPSVTALIDGTTKDESQQSETDSDNPTITTATAPNDNRDQNPADPSSTGKEKFTSLLLEISHSGFRIPQQLVPPTVKARLVASDELAGREDSADLTNHIHVDSNSPLARVACTLVDWSWTAGEEEEEEEEEAGEEGKPLVRTTPATKARSAVSQSFVRVNGDVCKCEISVHHQSHNTVVAIVRDVTERAKRFRAEQTANWEALARQRDAQTVNRFTRHEVKNGLLAGIELCDSLRSSIDDLSHHFLGQSIETFVEDVGVVGEEESESAGTASTIQRNNTSLESEAGGPDETRKASRAVMELEATLHEILEAVLAEAMARDVLHEIYRPRLERLDLKSILATSGVGKVGRFPLVILNETLPYISCDPQLLKYIVRNAISNACKYGKEMGIVETRVRYDFDRSMLHLEVINEPGFGHDMLLAMGEEARHAVFAQGARLHSTAEGSKQPISSGDGAWIMKKCATVMGGSCTIEFEENRTVFSFACPAPAVFGGETTASEQFRVPSNTWGIGIDDSKIQRKVLKQLMLSAGVKDSRIIVTGKSLDDVRGVEKIISKKLDDSPLSKMFVLVDENLDFSNTENKPFVISGSRLMETVLQKLPSSKAERILVLVRSANDSTEDVTQYCARTHGFFPKTPLEPDRVREIIAPLWGARFSIDKSGSSGDDESDECYAADLQQSLVVVDEAIRDVAEGKSSWSNLWGALQALKGDLMSSIDNARSREAVKAIAQMRGPRMPVDFEETWSSVREAVQSAINEMGDDSW